MRTLVPLLLLAACAAPPAESPPARYRDPGAVIASKADLDPARLAGPWFEVARLPPSAACARPQLSIRPSGTLLRIAGPCGAAPVLATVSGPGRLRLADGQERWVLWTDEAYRTAILVAPDGTAGMILNRAPALPVDRLRAALAVLDFNGFRTDALVFARSGPM